MVTTRTNPLVRILADSAANGVTIDLRGLDFTRGLKPRDLALLRAKAQRLSAFRLDSSKWVVSSGSDGATGYTVFIFRDGHLVCNCPAGKQGRLCKHVCLVEELTKLEQKPEPVPALKPKPQSAPHPESKPVPGSMLKGSLREIFS